MSYQRFSFEGLPVERKSEIMEKKRKQDELREMLNCQIAQKTKDNYISKYTRSYDHKSMEKAICMTDSNIVQRLPPQDDMPALSVFRPQNLVKSENMTIKRVKASLTPMKNTKSSIKKNFSGLRSEILASAATQVMRPDIVRTELRHSLSLSFKPSFGVD